MSMKNCLMFSWKNDPISVTQDFLLLYDNYESLAEQFSDQRTVGQLLGRSLLGGEEDRRRRSLSKEFLLHSTCCMLTTTSRQQVAALHTLSHRRQLVFSARNKNMDTYSVLSSVAESEPVEPQLFCRSGVVISYFG